MTTPPPRLPLTVTGYLGHIAFDGHTVTIRHKWGAARGTVSVPLQQLSGVECTRSPGSAGMFTLLAAGAVAPRRQTLARTNPLSLQFWPWQSKAFRHLRDVLLDAIRQQHAGLGPGAHGTPSLADELQRLGAMVQQGLLTPAEFEQAKARLLGGAH